MILHPFLSEIISLKQTRLGNMIMESIGADRGIILGNSKPSDKLT